MRQSILKMDKCEIFDLTEALYTFAVLHNQGINSDTYALQCEISEHYKPSMGWSETETINTNPFYHEITEQNIRNIWTRTLYYLDNRWDVE